MTNSFEDTVYVDNMELTLKYFKNLQHENLLFLSGESYYDDINGNPKRVCEIRDNIAFYMFPKIIENIHRTIDLFDDIFTDSAYFADLRFGLQDKDYDLFGGIAYLKENPGSYLSIKLI